MWLSDLDRVVDQKMKADNETPTLEETTNLQKELENLKAEQKNHREAEASWLKLRDDLTRQLANAMAANISLSLQLNERQRYGNGNHEGNQILQSEEFESDNDGETEDEEMLGEEEKHEEELEATPAIRNYISGFPLFGGFPPTRLTSPIALQAGPVVPDLASNVGYGRFLYIPAGRIRWYSGRTHAITCGPSFILHQDRWQEQSPFSKFFETTQEVFFAQGSSVYYAGTYKCHRPPDSIPQTIALPGDMSMGAMTDALRVPHGLEWADKRTLQKLFRHGILKLEYLVLECVGFNRRLHRRMIDGTGTVASGSSKRKRGPQTRPKKKRKVDS